MGGKIIAAALLAIAAFSCAGTPVKREDILWPPPPQEAKVKYLETIATKRDLGLTGWDKFLDAVFGLDPGLRPFKPWGVTTDGGDRVYVTDSAGGVFVYDRKNKVVYLIANSGQGALAQPLGIINDGNGKIWISDPVQRRVCAYDLEGGFALSVGTEGEFGKPTGIAVNRALKRVYISDTGKHVIRAYDTNGKFLFEFGKFGGAPGEFNFPASIAADKDRVYVTDQMNFRVQVFDKDGKFLLTFGSIGDRPGYFSRPKGIAVDSEGHIYVVDAAFDNVQIFGADGRILMSLGHGGNNPGEFSLPAGIYIDETDKIYVVEQLMRRVQVFQYLGGKGK